MSDKLTLDDLANLSNEASAIATINANNELIEEAFDNTLSRDGSSPNQMEAALDMNSNPILNLRAPTTANEPVRLQDLEAYADAALTIESVPEGGALHSVLKKNSAADYDYSWGDPLLYHSTDPGSIFYRKNDGTWGYLTPGTAGQVLQTNGPNTPPSWVNNVASVPVVSSDSLRHVSFMGPWEYAQVANYSGVDANFIALRANPTNHFIYDIDLATAVTGSSPNREITTTSTTVLAGPEKEISPSAAATLTFGGQVTHSAAGDCYDPQFTQEGLTFMRDMSHFTTEGYKLRSFHPFNFRWDGYPQYTKVRMVIFTGQSFNVGVSAYINATKNAYSTAPIAPGQALMFNGRNSTSPRIYGTHSIGDVNAYVHASGELATAVDLREGVHDTHGETSASAMAAHMIWSNPYSDPKVLGDVVDGYLDVDECLLMVNVAVSGMSIDDMQEGETNQMANLAMVVERAAIMCRVLGKDFEVAAVVFEQGNQDAGTMTKATYRTALNTWHDSVQDIVTSITGQASVPILMVQMTSAETVSNRHQIALAQLDACNDGSYHFYMSMPEYVLANPTGALKTLTEVGPDSDDGHPGAYSQYFKGAYLARTLRYIRKGENPQGLQVVSATRSGVTVTATLNTTADDFVTPLTLDTTLCSAATEAGSSTNAQLYGIRFRDGASTYIDIDSISISSDQLIITLNSTPALGGSEYLEIGMNETDSTKIGNQSGARTNYRDNSTETTTIATVALPLHNYLVTQEVTLS